MAVARIGPVLAQYRRHNRTGYQPMTDVKTGGSYHTTESYYSDRTSIIIKYKAKERSQIEKMDHKKTGLTRGNDPEKNEKQQMYVNRKREHEKISTMARCTITVNKNVSI